jgi:hypothetical protein
MPSSTSSDVSDLMLSPHELSRLVLEPSMPPIISHTFRRAPTQTAVLRYYAFLSQSIYNHEKELERLREEQEAICGFLTDSPMFRRRVAPLVNDFRRWTRRPRFHPYSRTPTPPSTPSNDNSSEPPSDIVIHPAASELDAASSLSLYCTAIDNPTIEEEQELGSKKNPIDVYGDDECEGCREEGHAIGDCTKEYRQIRNHYVPIEEGDIRMEEKFVVDTTHLMTRELSLEL